MVTCDERCRYVAIVSACPGITVSKRKKRVQRAELRKNRTRRVRDRSWTERYADDNADDVVKSERVRGKNPLSAKRTVTGELREDEASGLTLVREHATDGCLAGVVLRAGGHSSDVLCEDGRRYACAVRRLLKTLDTEQRHVIAAGDNVLVRPANRSEGFIEQIEPRHGVLSRASRGRRQILAANIDLMLIVASAAEPRLKPHLIDRLVVTAEQAEIEPVVCINKIDLVVPADLQPIAGVYSQIGCHVLLLSATRGWSISSLRELVRGRRSTVVGQSGVGKSSLLNSLDPGLALRVQKVSDESEKGRHTTTAAELVELSCGGYIVDTPGIRQFQLWDVIPEEVESLFRDIRPFIDKCHFPNCRHLHESPCAVKDAVADGKLDARRYESYCQMVADEN